MLTDEQAKIVSMMQLHSVARLTIPTARRDLVKQAWESGIENISVIARLLHVSRDTVIRDLALLGLRELVVKVASSANAS